MGAEWVEESGSPDDPTEAEALAALSPYHSVAADRSYPGTLLITFTTDSRVHPMHGRKICAALQHAAHRLPMALREHEKASHGAKSRRTHLDYYAEILAVTAWCLGR